MARPGWTGLPQERSSIGRAPVSKTGGCEFDSRRSCLIPFVSPDSERASVSREIASNTPQPLSANLLRASVYKPSQGRVVRQLTALAIWLIVAMGCYRLSLFLRGGVSDSLWIHSAIPATLLAAGLWFGFRVVNWPRFADFLISVEAEMGKVTWPSKSELIRASVVVILTIVILAISLFLFDVVWQWFFKLIGVAS
jgi:preprotein translocase subunit SecE